VKSVCADFCTFHSIFENLQLADDVLEQNTFMRKLSIVSLLLLRQFMKLRFLGRNLVVRMKLAQTQISGISQDTNLFGKQTTAFFEQIKIMLVSIGKGRCNDRLRLLVDD
jgi:hypothetical protein